MDQFLQFISQYVSLSEEAEATLTELVRVETYKKGAQIINEGRVCNRLFFLETGSVRTFFYRDGKDITYWIYPEYAVFTAWNSYLTQKPSKEYAEATQDAVVYSLSYSEWQELYASYPELERFGRLIAEEFIAYIDDFYKGFYLLSAKEKYELLLAVFPDVTQRVKLGHIASMLGITQETLSRLRGK